MRNRDFVLVFLGMSLLAVSAVQASWGPDGVTVLATTENIPKVSATNDGGFGSLVVWQQEGSPGSGVLRAQHVLANGDVDPAWPAEGVLVCGEAADRDALGVVADRLGGCYVWWKEGAALYLSRVDPSGAVATGWPARGRMLGVIRPAGAHPGVTGDGAHGIYLAWPAFIASATDPMGIFVIRLGPDNTGAGGWPGTPSFAAGGDPVATADYWPQLAAAPNDEVFMGWAVYSDDPQRVPSVFRLTRLTAEAISASGWPYEGLALGEFHAEWLTMDPWLPPTNRLVSVSADGRGGVFFLRGVPVSMERSVESRLFRFEGGGAPAADWPAAGVLVTAGGYPDYGDWSPDLSHRVLADGMDGAQAAIPDYYDHDVDIRFRSTEPDGSWKPSSDNLGDVDGYEVVANHTGGVFLATFHPHGPTGPFQPSAHLRVTQSLGPAGWSGFYESHDQPVLSWYGDIGLAESGDGGAVFFWSQVRERFGLFARRFSSQGMVTGVEPPPASGFALGRLRFVVGEGVRVSLSLTGAEPARLDLYDVAGRRVAATRLEGVGAGPRDVTLPGTRDLPAGLYFANLVAAGQSRGGRVVVTP